MGEICDGEVKISMAGKHAIIPAKTIIKGGASIGPDVIAADYTTDVIETGQYIQTRRLPYEI